MMTTRTDKRVAYLSSRHADVDKEAIVMPDRLDPGTERGDEWIGPLGE